MRDTISWATLVLEHKYLMLRNPKDEFSKVDPKLFKAVEKEAPFLLANCNKNFFNLEPESYCRTLILMLQFEKIHRDILMRKFDQREVCIKLDKESNERFDLYYFKLRGLSKGYPKLCLGDSIILDNRRNEPEHFTIRRIVGDVLKFSWLKGTSRNIVNVPFNMSFHSLAIPTRRCIENLCEIQRQESQGNFQIRRMLFMGKKYKNQLGPNWGPVAQQVPIIDFETTRTAELDARLRRNCNEQQRGAIQNIMEAKCRPSLYILFGPPGTGKTATLIEAVVQMYLRDPKVKILLCAQSNNCVDDLCAKLNKIEQVKDSDLIRLCSVNYYNYLLDGPDEIPNSFTNRPFDADGRRIVITTNLMVFKLEQKFDFVLMDEASSTNIAESLLPCSRLRQNGCFVLVGDPKQLGPVVMSQEISHVGLGVSLLEYMFSKEAYGYHRGKYDSHFITKLVLSYRSDERLLQLNNKEFYKNELKFTAKTPPDLLRKLKFDRPLVFKRVLGEALRMVGNYSPSWRNDQEADECIDFLFKLYCIGLEPHQIGIIAYYGLQKAVLIEKFEEKLGKHKAQLRAVLRAKNVRAKKKAAKKSTLPNGSEQEKLANSSKKSQMNFDWLCKIDTVDAFQGHERDVIIVSTTRTNATPFLIDPKRFNVATSRARWLTVVVGHPDVLNTCKLWRKFAQFAYLP